MNRQGSQHSAALAPSRRTGTPPGGAGPRPFIALRAGAAAVRDPALAARVLAYVLAAGALEIIAIAALLPARGADTAGLIGTAALAFAMGLLLEAAADRCPPAALVGAACAACALAGAAIYFRGGPLVAYSLLFLGPVLYAFSFLSRTAASAVLAAALTSLGAALTLLAQPPADAVELWLVTATALGAAGCAVWAMRRRYEFAVNGLASAARTDPLTALLNRRGFEESFDLELERARRGDRRLSLLVGDLDGFKLINDRLGHQAGDVALERVGAILQGRKRRIDTVARLGGEEFALIVPDAGDRSAYMLAERLRTAVAEEFAADKLPLTISIGVATYPDHGDSCESLLGAADDALYAAKELGRDRTVIFSREVPAILDPAGRGRKRDEHLDTLLALAETLDRREAPSAPHSRRVGRYAELTARELGLPDETVERVRLAGALHDVGKIAIPDLLLSKTAPLSDDEWDEIRRHPEIGAHMLANAHLGDIGRWVIAHHERPDGRGFPLGLESADIPLEARILAVADAYEAMISERPYRPPLTTAHARAELERNAGTQFDPRVVAAFTKALERVGSEV